MAFESHEREIPADWQRPTLQPVGWTLHEVQSVPSTNDALSEFGAWTALRAETQTGGRGRHQRSWVSDVGGLWLSASVPVGEPGKGWAALPLAAGLAVCETLQELGARPLHLRWPNDIMSGPRKLAGLLVDQFRPGIAVIGVGVNVRNRPEQEDSELTGQTVRLVDLVEDAPEPAVLAVALLTRLAGVVRRLDEVGFPGLVARLNCWWRPELPVEIHTETEAIRGRFVGVDDLGRLQIRRADASVRVLAAHQVMRLRECDREHEGIES